MYFQNKFILLASLESFITAQIKHRTVFSAQYVPITAIARIARIKGLAFFEFYLNYLIVIFKAESLHLSPSTCYYTFWVIFTELSTEQESVRLSGLLIPSEGMDDFFLSPIP
jgi:hypothetical protein